ncbi:Ada metal-binding domain-containing protein [Novosphingobium resinovorum]
MTNADRHIDRTASDPRWAQVVARDKSADGKLWYSVATTGIYCRPSCPSRTANPGT